MSIRRQQGDALRVLCAHRLHSLYMPVNVVHRHSHHNLTSEPQRPNLIRARTHAMQLPGARPVAQRKVLRMMGMSQPADSPDVSGAISGKPTAQNLEEKVQLHWLIAYDSSTVQLPSN